MAAPIGGAAKSAHSRKPRRGRLSQSYATGILAEWLCAAYLWAGGWRILARRWRCPSGEIDMIICRGQQLCFVEIKARQYHATAQHSITPMQQQRIQRAASHWLAQNGKYASLTPRFDVMSVALWPWPKHLKNAF